MVLAAGNPAGSAGPSQDVRIIVDALTDSAVGQVADLFCPAPVGGPREAGARD